jgi:broad specificity phosphatase PhoE
VPVTILGLRHGEVHNPGGVIYSGLPNFFLSETGRTEAAAAAEALRRADVRAIYASPLDRAQQTARFISDATGAEIRTDERLVEWNHWEQWAGLTWEELAAGTKLGAKDAFDAYLNDPGSVTSGESLAQLADRVVGWLDDVSAEHEEGVVVGVSHLEPLRAVLLRALNRPATDLFDLQIGHCGIVRLRPHPMAEPFDPTQL